MGIRKQVLIGLCIIFIGLLGLLLGTSRFFVLKGFLDLEMNDQNLRTRQMIAKFNALLSSVSAVAGDWASWDEAYNFVMDGNEGFIRTNLQDATLVNLKVGFLAFFRTDGRLVYAKFIDPATGKEALPSPETIDRLFPDHPNDETAAQNGVIQLPQGPAFVAYSPVRHGDNSGPIRGLLAVGRFIDRSLMDAIRTDLQFDLSVHNLDETANDPVLYQAAAILTAGAEEYVKPLDRGTIAGFSLLRDINHKPLLIAKATSPRTFYAQGRKTILYLLVVVFLIILAFLVLFAWIVDKFITRPLTALEESVALASERNLRDRIMPMSRNTPFNRLLRNINIMLSELNIHQATLETSNRELETAIGECRRVEEALFESEQRLRNQNAGFVEVFRVMLGDVPDFASLAPTITRMAAAVFDADMAAIWVYNSTHSRIICADRFLGSAHEGGMEVFLSERKDLFEILQKHRLYAASDAAADPVAAALFRGPLAVPGITSFLHASIGSDDQSHGTLILGTIERRKNWTVDDEGFAATIADILFQFIEGKALRDAEADHRWMETRHCHQERMEALGIMARGLAHDLNNILSGLVTYPELLLYTMPKDSPYRQHVETIMNSGERAATVMRDLSLIARKGISALIPLDLNEVIQGYLNSPAHAELIKTYPGITLESRLEPDLLNMPGSPAHLTRILQILLGHAFAETGDAGMVRMTTNNVYRDHSFQSHLQIPPGEYIMLRVADEGPGMNPHELERLFEPFFYRKVMGRGGSGLGPAIVWGIVASHDGYLTAESAGEGRGTTISAYFPLTREGTEPAIPNNPPSPAAGQGKIVLVIEDQVDQWEIAKEILLGLNYRPIHAASGESAMAIIEEHPVDLALLDMVMAPGLDGPDTFLRLTASHPGLTIIMTGADPEQPQVERSLAMGACRYVRKPYTIAKLASALQEC